MNTKTRTVLLALIFYLIFSIGVFYKDTSDALMRSESCTSSRYMAMRQHLRKKNIFLWPRCYESAYNVLILTVWQLQAQTTEDKLHTGKIGCKENPCIFTGISTDGKSSKPFQPRKSLLFKSRFFSLLVIYW